MATFRLASPAPGAYIEVEATENADGLLVCASAAWENLTDKPMTFSVKRATGVSVIDRTVNAGTSRTTANIPGSAANRTIVSCSTVWGS